MIGFLSSAIFAVEAPWKIDKPHFFSFAAETSVLLFKG
jgi:hypothetical protein